MTLAISQSATILAPNRGAAFGASGGVEPYSFAVVPGGAGGTVNASTGIYTAPNVFGADTVRVTDAAAATATAHISVGNPLQLLCDILRRELGLASNRVYLWNQKIMQPTDDGLYIAVGMPAPRPFGNVARFTPSVSGGEADQWVAMVALVDIDVVSKSTAALDRKEEVLLALASFYSQRQQEANGFSIGRLSSRILNLSEVDGAAIPYRFRISVNMQYAFSKTTAGASYYDTFQRDTIADDGSVVDTATLITADDATPPATDVIDGGDAETTLSE